MKKIKINCFKPYAKVFCGNTLNDYFYVNLYMCNYLGLKVSIFGYGFEIGSVIYDSSKKLNVN